MREFELLEVKYINVSLYKTALQGYPPPLTAHIHTYILHIVLSLIKLGHGEGFSWGMRRIIVRA